MHELTRARVVAPGKLRLRFADKTTGDADLSPFCEFGGIWARLADPGYFAAFTITPDGITWPDGGQVRTPYLYHQARRNPARWWRHG